MHAQRQSCRGAFTEVELLPSSGGRIDSATARVAQGFLKPLTSLRAIKVKQCDIHFETIIPALLKERFYPPKKNFDAARAACFLAMCFKIVLYSNDFKLYITLHVIFSQCHQGFGPFLCVCVFFFTQGLPQSGGAELHLCADGH